MPFTPFHLSLPLIVIASFRITGRERGKWTSASLVLGSIAPDIQGAASLFIDRRIPLHGFSHTIMGSLFYSLGYLLFINTVLLVRSELGTRRDVLIQVSIFELSILFFHLLPDALIYDDVALLWPVSDLSMVLFTYEQVARFLGLLFLPSLLLLLIGLVVNSQGGDGDSTPSQSDVT